MDKYLVIDNRLRNFEKDKLLNLGYKLIEIPKMENVYEEISSHPDIFMFKTHENEILEENLYNTLNYKLDSFINSKEIVEENYPFDIKFNVAVIGNIAIHNFKYTSKKVLDYLNNNNYKLIDIKQGYANCSIAIIDENSIIISDKGIYNALKGKTDLNILLIDEILDIKLLNGNSYSEKNGFIGGVISRIDDFIFVSGDLDKIDKDGKIRKFVCDRGLSIIDFKDKDIIDFGGIIKI